MQYRVIVYAIAMFLPMFAFCGNSAFAALPVSVEDATESPVGLHAAYFKEKGAELSIGEAVAAYLGGNFIHGDSPVFNFGIGSSPVWIGFDVENKTGIGQLRRLSVQIPWLDKVDVYFINGKGIAASYKLGDAQVFAKRPIVSRFFDIDHKFEAGISQVLIRVETSDPMVIPVYLRSINDAVSFDGWQNHSYGFVYGFLVALIAYNAMLYIGLRSRRYIYYSIYLTVFMLMNMAYTGHGFEWLWPEQVRLQLWIIPFLMVLFGMSGLLFATSFLNTRVYLPRMHRAIILMCALSGLLLLVLFLFNYNALHMALAFIFVVLFSAFMLLLGTLSVRSGYKPARYYLLGAIAAMTGALLTDLSVAGFIPYNPLTYRAVEIGILADAIFLALALAYQFRINQKEKFDAVLLARIDSLTGLNNRRAFYEFTKPIWSNALRNRRDVSLILLDIDDFKQINDIYGHAIGDEVLIAIASVLAQSAREGDVVARWGGEEFILFLPETQLEAATALAERLRVAISEIRIAHAKNLVSFTASLGVAQMKESCRSIEELVSIADICLYQVKHDGKNKVQG